MSKKISDMLVTMYEQQREFNGLLRDHRNQPDFPLDLSLKESQKLLKDIASECMHELFEANHHLKNSKTHRATDLPDFDRESYKEELCDALHYFFGILVYSGITADEIFDAYMRKGKINFQRITSGY